MSAGFETSLYGFLVGQTALTATLSHSTAVYPVGETPSDAPERCIVYQRISSVPQRTLAGLAVLQQERYQFDCYARTHREAQGIADALRGSLDCLRSEIGISGANVVRAFCDNDSAGYDAPQDGSGDGYHKVVLDFVIWHS